MGALTLASSNPENADAGWLSPEHWRDSGEETSSSQLSDAPSTDPTPETTETGTTYEPTEDGAAATETANPQGTDGAGPTDSPAGDGQGTGATGNASPAPSAANGTATAPDAGDGTQASGTAGSTGVAIPAEPRQ